MERAGASGTVLATSCLLLLAGCVELAKDLPAGTTAAATGEGSAPAVGRVDWSGHVLASETDVLMHVYPTEGALWSFEQSGIVVEMPEGVAAIEVAVAWSGSGRFGIHLHSYNTSGAWVGHRSSDAQWDENPHCIRVPAEDVAPGHWMVMIHSDGAVRTDYTLSVITQGGEPTVMKDERHGHRLAEEWLEGRDREEHDAETCALWGPVAEGEGETGGRLQGLKAPAARFAEG